MKKMIYFVLLLTCYQAQATLGGAVDFAANAVREYNKEENKPYIVAQEEVHPVKTLTSEFMKGFLRTASPALIFVGYDILNSAYQETAISLAGLLTIDRPVILVSGAVCLDECITHGDVVVSGLKKEAACNRCVQPISNMHRLKELAHIVGSVTAVGLLVMLTSAKDQ